MSHVSVIIPVYNVEPYLRRCVDSVLAQTFQDFEVILVDDGSPDNCGAICDEYAAKDARIHVIHQANGGPSSARNAGLDHAQGEYITFVDGDDHIDPSLLSSALAGMKDYDSVCFNYHEEDISGVVKRRSSFSPGPCRWKNEKELFLFLFTAFFNFGYAYCVWNRLFRKSIIDQHKLRFEENALYAEDLRFNLLYYFYSHSLNCLAGDYYSYLVHPGSIIQDAVSRCHFDRMVEMSKGIYEYLHAQGNFPFLTEKFPVIFYGLIKTEIDAIKVPHPEYTGRDIRKMILSDVHDLPYFYDVAADLRHHRKDLQICYGMIGSFSILSDFRYFCDGKLLSYYGRTLFLYLMKLARKMLHR